MAEYVAVTKKSWFQCLHHKEKKERRLVVLCPYLEEALYTAASSVSILPSTFGLPQTAKELHGWGRYDKNKEYRHFLKTIMGKNPDFSIIREWLSG